MNKPFTSIFEGTAIKTKQISIDPAISRIMKARSRYAELYGTLTEEELKELPSGVAVYPTGLYRTISRAKPLDHIQLIHYKQPLLGDQTTEAYIKTIIESTKPEWSDVRLYLKNVRELTFDSFPFAFQIAYDMHTTGALSDRVYALEQEFNNRYNAILEELE